MITPTTSKTAYNSRTADKFVVRLPEGMRERLAEVSKENIRSMNSEIIVRLESTFADEGNDTGAVSDASAADAPMLREINKALALKTRLIERMFNQMPETSDPLVLQWRAEMQEMLGVQQSAASSQQSL